MNIEVPKTEYHLKKIKKAVNMMQRKNKKHRKEQVGGKICVTCTQNLK